MDTAKPEEPAVPAMQPKEPSKAVGDWIWLSLLIIGLGIGWLTGLSASPVVNVVIAGIVGVVAAFGPKQAPKEDSDKSNSVTNKFTITFGQLAWVVAGIMAGTLIGMTFRTHDLLNVLPWPPRSTPASLEVETWVDLTSLDKQAVAKRIFANKYPSQDYSLKIADADILDILNFWSSTGVSQTVVAGRLFDLIYPANTIAPNTVASVSEINGKTETASVLYGASGSVCSTLTRNLILYNDLQAALRDTPSLQILSTITDTVKLRTFVEEVVCDLSQAPDGN